MSECKPLKRKNRRVCIGDLSDLIEIQTRTIVPPIDGSVDYNERFTTIYSNVWAMIETKTGVEIFDGVNIIGVATHLFYIRFIPDITFQNWITLKNEKYNIVDVENLEARDEFYLLKCSKRGDETRKANFSR